MLRHSISGNTEQQSAVCLSGKLPHRKSLPPSLRQRKEGESHEEGSTTEELQTAVGSISADTDILPQAQDGDTSDEALDYEEEPLPPTLFSDDVEPEDYPTVPQPTKSAFPTRFPVPSDPIAYESALQSEIAENHRLAHLSSSEFELTFELQYTTSVSTTQPGEKIMVVGSLDLLGAWNPAAGLEMEWTQGHVWRLTITLAEGLLPQFEYKYMLVSPRKMRWEGGRNRRFAPEQFTGVHGPKVSYFLTSKWQV